MPLRNPVSCLLLLLIGCACVATSSSASAQSWDWTYGLQAAPADAAPAAVSRPDAHGFWALGAGLLHYRTDGTLDVARNSYMGDSALSASLSDGGILFTNSPHTPLVDFMQPYDCEITAYSASGSPRWQTRVPADYQFDQSDVAHSYAGLSGTTNLVKIGGCTAP
jgi:hypothetical protein